MVSIYLIKSLTHRCWQILLELSLLIKSLYLMLEGKKMVQDVVTDLVILFVNIQSLISG